MFGKVTSRIVCCAKIGLPNRILEVGLALSFNAEWSSESGRLPALGWHDTCTANWHEIPMDLLSPDVFEAFEP